MAVKGTLELMASWPGLLWLPEHERSIGNETRCMQCTQTVAEAHGAPKMPDILDQYNVVSSISTVTSPDLHDFHRRGYR